MNVYMYDIYIYIGNPDSFSMCSCQLMAREWNVEHAAEKTQTDGCVHVPALFGFGLQCFHSVLSNLSQAHLHSYDSLC